MKDGLPDKTDVRAALKIVQAVAEVIHDEGEAPAGVVYAALQSFGIRLAGFQTIVEILKSAGWVEERNNVLKWVGPAEVPQL